MKVNIAQIKAKYIEDGYNLHAVEDHVENLIKESLDDEGCLLPPWLKYPEFSHYSIEWRMGVGEDYITLLQFWHQCLSESEKLYYKEKYPRPMVKQDEL